MPAGQIFISINIIINVGIIVFINIVNIVITINIIITKNIITICLFQVNPQKSLVCGESTVE